MKIVIKLDDPKYCDGCILLDDGIVGGNCPLFKEYNFYDKFDQKTKKLLRPQECIDKHGE